MRKYITINEVGLNKRMRKILNKQFRWNGVILSDSEHLKWLHSSETVYLNFFSFFCLLPPRLLWCIFSLTLFYYNGHYLVIITGAQLKAGTSHKMQTVSVRRERSTRQIWLTWWSKPLWRHGERSAQMHKIFENGVVASGLKQLF